MKRGSQPLRCDDAFIQDSSLFKVKFIKATPVVKKFPAFND